MFKNLKIGTRLTLSFFLIAIISVSVIGYISFHQSKKSLKAEYFNQLTAVREMKSDQIEDYFKVIRSQVLTFSADPTIIRAMQEFKTGFEKVAKDVSYTENEFEAIKKNVAEYYQKNHLANLNNTLNIPITPKKELPVHRGTIILQNHYIANSINNDLKFSNNLGQYAKTHTEFHHFFKNYLEQFGYYDIFLIDSKTGQIVYTVEKEVDFGTSLLTGPFRQTNIAEIFNASNESNERDFVKVVDYEPYPPSCNAHAAFIASPIYDGKEKIGVLCFQMPIDKINDIMTSHKSWSDVGLGESGETYIVGQDYTLRNQSRFLIEDSLNYFKMIQNIGVPKETVSRIRNQNNTIGLQEVKTKGTKAALAGKSGVEIFKDYRGVSVLSAYRPLKIKNLNWVIMSEIDEQEAFEPIYKLEAYIFLVFCVLAVLIMLASFEIARRITKPLKHLTGGAKQLAKGNMNAVIAVQGKDEIGVLALSFKKMQISINHLISELKDINQNLETKVKDRTLELSKQKNILSEKNKEIIDSIRYAKRIQSAILPPDKMIKEYLNNSFILYKPKDIVAGDFYWLEHIDGKVLFAAADCTGHGVPGAMVSVVCNNALNRSVREYGLTDPGQILDKAREIVIQEFEKSDDDVKDGMDIALCSLEGKKLQYAGAHNPLWIIRKGELIEANEIPVTFYKEQNLSLIEIKADKQPIGKFFYPVPYTTKSFNLIRGDTIYMFSDGYVDQFGGENLPAGKAGGKKFKSRKLKELLLEIQNKSMDEQKILIDEIFEQWKANLEQVDDVCVIGVRI